MKSGFIGALIPVGVVFLAQSSGVMPDDFTLQRVFELMGSAGIVGVLTLWLMDTRRQLEAQRAMFQKELEAEKIAHESTRRMLIDMLKEQRPIYGHFEGDTKRQAGNWADRIAANRAAGMSSGLVDHGE